MAPLSGSDAPGRGLPEPGAAVPHGAVVWSIDMQAAGAPPSSWRSSIPGTLDAIQRYRVTHGQFVPTMFVRMLKLPDDVRKKYDVSSLERSSTPLPVPVEIKPQMIDWWGPIVDEYYGAPRRRLHADHRRGMARAPRLGRRR